jgi:DNA-binding MarR family transcriptional regulator
VRPDEDDIGSWPTGRLLATAARLTSHAWNVEIAPYGVNHAGVAVLAQLGQGALPQRELAARCQVEEQTLSRTVERLERAGYVRRHRDDVDRRRVLVERTSSGEEALAAIRRQDSEVIAVLDGVEDPELFRRQLAQVVRRLSAGRFGSATEGQTPAEADRPDRGAGQPPRAG